VVCCCVLVPGSTHHGSVAFGRVGLTQRIIEAARAAGTAAWAVIVCSPLLFASRPKTPLRVLCIAAFEFLARWNGETLGRRRRLAMALACDLGSLCDDYYDHRELDKGEYRSLHGMLRQVAPKGGARRYIRELREAERRRPILSSGTPGVVNAVAAYRAKVLSVSLRWLHEISGLTAEAVKLHVLLSLVGLIQLADDVVDWKDDHAALRPSYVTCLITGPGNVANDLRSQANALLQRIIDAAKQDAGTVPLAIAGILTWSLVMLLVRVRFPQ